MGKDREPWFGPDVNPALAFVMGVVFLMAIGVLAGHIMLMFK